MLLEQVWGYRHAADTRLVNVHVQRLRAKVEHDPEHPAIVLTVRGVGYKAGSVGAGEGGPVASPAGLARRAGRRPAETLPDRRRGGALAGLLGGALTLWRRSIRTRVVGHDRRARSAWWRDPSAGC